MPVGIENESGKIIWTVFGMKPYTSIIASALVKRRSIESSYSLPRRRSKGNMETLTWHDDSLATSPDGKFIIGAGYAIANGRFLTAIGGFMSPSADIAERSERCIIKAGRTFEINHGEGKMMKHMHRRFEA